MDVIGYYREIATVNYLAPVIENWFLAAAPNNLFSRVAKQYAPIKHLGRTTILMSWQSAMILPC